jgi:DNA-directed RNA polymerase specialized sigma24 family protein
MGDEAGKPVEPGAVDTALPASEPVVPDADDRHEVHDDELVEEPDAVEPITAEPEPENEGTQVVQDAPAPTPAQLRVDFGAHLEANYRRLVAQLYAITLDPAEAHSAVQDAYSRAWRSWATVSRSPDSVGWVRRVAVRSTIRSWRRLRPRRYVGPGPETPTGALLATLRELPVAERRCVVLHHMAGAPVKEIAAVEGVSVGTTAARLARAQQVVSNGLITLPAFADEWDADLGGHLNSGAFAPDEPSDGYDGWTPDWDDYRPADEEDPR